MIKFKKVQVLSKEDEIVDEKTAIILKWEKNFRIGKSLYVITNTLRTKKLFNISRVLVKLYITI